MTVLKQLSIICLIAAVVAWIPLSAYSADLAMGSRQSDQSTTRGDTERETTDTPTGGTTGTTRGGTDMRGGGTSAAPDLSGTTDSRSRGGSTTGPLDSTTGTGTESDTSSGTPRGNNSSKY